jgi:hypothetical protein
LAPRVGDSDNISFRAKNLLNQMDPALPAFSIMRYIWHEIITCSHDGKSSCHYAPYIFKMILHVTGLNILTNKSHIAYKPVKGKLDQLLRIGSHALPNAPKKPISGVLSIGEPSSSRPLITPLEEEEEQEAHRSPSRPPKMKKGKSTLRVLVEGVFACFKSNKHISEQLYKQRIEACKAQKRQKAIMEKLGMAYSPEREERDVTPPPSFANPWYDEGPSHVFGPGVQEREEEGNEEESESEDTSYEEPSDPSPVAKGKGKQVASDSDYDGED